MPVRGEADLSRGDLLYLPGHVLIYAGGGAVIHADGASMMVRQDDLARTHSIDFRIVHARRNDALVAKRLSRSNQA